MTRKAEHLRAQTEGYSVLEKLRHEIREYRGILKCSICVDRQKEVRTQNRFTVMSALTGKKW